MRGKCNCGKKATSEFLIEHRGIASTMKYCSSCEPKYVERGVTKIYGK